MSVQTPVDLDELRRSCEAAKNRDSLIVAAKLQGVPIKTLTEITGLSHQRIYQILSLAGASTQTRTPKTEPTKPALRSLEEEWDDSYS